MQLSEDELNKRYGTLCKPCNRNTLLPYEYEFTCLSCGFNLIKRKYELSKTQRKKNFIIRSKYAEYKIFCICIDVYKIYEGNDFEEIYKVLWTLKHEKLKMNIILIEKYKDMLENPDFEQNYCSKTAEGFYKIGHGSIRIMKWLIHYDRSDYDNMNYFALLCSIC